MLKIKDNAMNIFAAIAAIVLASTCVVASTTAAPVTVRVSYADLNLSSPAGRGTLTRRLTIAARQTCAVNAGERDLSVKAYTALCYKVSIADAKVAMEQVMAPHFASR
ncbi:UrcA family protein [Polymorphobacter megasporae]|uniref:UrcA family protein n=1 Tax=Glacieibacterium megasporae TaxID=2835787 RepID=UPI001C1E3F9B|nr:UrcA family protein [Polymorphobacter megasporae]UAJ08886.1 UrcA family protein [Polymorphobacter megasporae]